MSFVERDEGSNSVSPLDVYYWRDKTRLDLRIQIVTFEIEEKDKDEENGLIINTK